MTIQKETKKETKKETTRPNEVGGIHIEGHVKIFDPENDKVFVNVRG